MEDLAGNALLEAAEQVLPPAVDLPDPFASMWKGLVAIKSRLREATANVVNMECCSEPCSNYYSSWARSVAEEDVLEQNADDGWGETVAEKPAELIAVFGACSMGSQAREATASFVWEEIDTASGDRRARQPRDASGSSAPPVLDKRIVVRTGSFVVFKYQGMNVRGVALWFILYLPPKGDGQPLMLEFKNQVVLFAYVHVAVLQRNCLVVRVCQHQLVRCPPRLTTHPSPHRLCTRATARIWPASHAESCAKTALSATGTLTCTRACRPR